jgi:tyrosinase
MAVIRRNILSDNAVRDRFIRGAQLLKQENSGRTTADLGITGPSRSVSTYDLFTAWHHMTMMRMTPPNNSAGRNAAHRGPIFLPWHRVMLLVFERNLQRVLVDADFGLPYWDWAADGELSAAQQRTSLIWRANCLGGQGNPVQTGPFAFSTSGPQQLACPSRIKRARGACFRKPRPSAIFRHRRCDYSSEEAECEQCSFTDPLR